MTSLIFKKILQKLVLGKWMHLLCGEKSPLLYVPKVELQHPLQRQEWRTPCVLDWWCHTPGFCFTLHQRDAAIFSCIFSPNWPNSKGWRVRSLWMVNYYRGLYNESGGFISRKVWKATLSSFILLWVLTVNVMLTWNNPLLYGLHNIKFCVYMDSYHVHLHVQWVGCKLAKRVTLN